MSRDYCADLSRAAHEPMAGSADRVDAWILLEYRTAWSAKATTDNALTGETRAWLDGLAAAAAARALKPRVQFIRRPELETAGVTLMVAAAGALHRIDADDYRGLARHSFDAVLAAPPQAAAQYFVCTNGQRDLCCARFGLPTYQALRERVGERVWQTTHVGGHRFAPNVLALPQAALYGRVRPDDVEAFLATVEHGRLAAPWLRGRTGFDAAVQAAEAALAERGIDTAMGARAEPNGAGQRIWFGANAVDVTPGPAHDAIASCGDTAPKPVPTWRVSVRGR